MNAFAYASGDETLCERCAPCCAPAVEPHGRCDGCGFDLEAAALTHAMNDDGRDEPVHADWSER